MKARWGWETIRYDMICTQAFSSHCVSYSLNLCSCIYESTVWIFTPHHRILFACWHPCVMWDRVDTKHGTIPWWFSRHRLAWSTYHYLTPITRCDHLVSIKKVGLIACANISQCRSGPVREPCSIHLWVQNHIHCIHVMLYYVHCPGSRNLCGYSNSATLLGNIACLVLPCVNSMPVKLWSPLSHTVEPPLCWA